MAGRDYKHDDRCLACHGACNNDKVKKCRLCPVALHAKCAVNGASGKEARDVAVPAARVFGVCSIDLGRRRHVI